MSVDEEDLGSQVPSKRSASSAAGSSDRGQGQKNPKKKSKHSKTESSTGAHLQTRKSELAKTRQKLPVYKFKKELTEYLNKKDVLLVVAETGSGKSTQIPAYLDESGLFSSRKSKFGRSICVTQPRRVAAVTVSKRVAEERGCDIGTAVGYRVRFDDCTLKTTRIIYATDGMLLRESMSDPLLTRYSVVVLDEAHERSLQTDILFGVVSRAMVARGAQVKRNQDPEESGAETMDAKSKRRMRERAQQLDLPRLKVVVMSATLDVQTFQAFFNDAAIVQIPGRQFPVEILYTKDPQEVSRKRTLVIVIDPLSP